jgi:hypothetical protein
MAIMIMLKNRKRNESTHKAYQQCSFPVVNRASLRGQGQEPEDGGKEAFLLNINFSVGVNMYSEKVTCNS